VRLNTFKYFQNLFQYSSFDITKVVFQKSLALLYAVAYLILINQGPGLFGDKGILPANLFIERIDFWRSPSLFHLGFNDPLLLIFSSLGFIVSILAVIGITEKYGSLLSSFSWFFLWAVYLSFINIGQTFYGYGWETMLTEVGFLAIFLGPKNVKAPTIIIWLIRWVSFRNMLGAGLIKIRGDSCWHDLSCMYVYYETQPVPNPLSIYFHRLPNFIHQSSVLFTHFVELVVPFGLMAPWRRVAIISGSITIFFHFIIISSGNLAWLNYLSLIICIPCFDDQFFNKFCKFKIPKVRPIPMGQKIGVFLLTVLVVWRSYYPIMNMISSGQSMNRGYDPFHLVNTYGAFGSITKIRNELVVLGTMDKNPKTAKWKTYHFRGKPTDPNRMPTIMSPYHWHLDWQMWFAAFGDYRYSPWMLNFVAKLLQSEPNVLGLIKSDPFNGKRPKWIKVDFYRYQFQDYGKKGWWKRTYKGQWLPPLNLENKGFLKILKSKGWYPGPSTKVKTKVNKGAMIGLAVINGSIVKEMTY